MIEGASVVLLTKRGILLSDARRDADGVIDVVNQGFPAVAWGIKVSPRDVCANESNDGARNHDHLIAHYVGQKTEEVHAHHSAELAHGSRDAVHGRANLLRVHGGRQCEGGGIGSE